MQHPQSIIESKASTEPDTANNMILEDSFSSLESCAFDGKLADFEDAQIMADAGGDDQEAPLPERSNPMERQSSTTAASVSTASASLDLSTIWSVADEAEQSTSQEEEAYNSSLEQMEKLEDSLNQDMIGILNNQASVTELRISAIQNFLRLQGDSSSSSNSITSPTTMRRKCLRNKEDQFNSMRDLRPKKSVRFEISPSQSSRSCDGRLL